MDAIYSSTGRAREYRELACNLYVGCNHGCKYCWAPLVRKINRGKFHSSVMIRPGILAQLERDAARYAAAGETRQVLICFTCDPYYDGEDSHQTTRQAIMILKKHGLNVCILTKGGTRSCRDLDLLGSSDSYACTLTTMHDNISQEWEPNAALPMDRLMALQRFHDAGIPTWVSLEPVLDPGMTLEIIEQIHPLVDHFKVGMLNYHALSKTINWREFALDAACLLTSLGKSFYIKQDLLRLAPELAQQHSA